MERTVPTTASEEVELYLRTYYSLLRSSSPVSIQAIAEAHAGMKSLLHPDARQSKPDMSALVYSLLRLPACIHRVKNVILGQSLDVFRRAGYTDVENWEPVAAPARRRRCYFNGQDTLACFIASRTDIDDVIPLLAAYQIEWNKIHTLLLAARGGRLDLSGLDTASSETMRPLADLLELTLEDLRRLKTIWGAEFAANLEKIAAGPRHVQVRLLNGSLTEYRRATNTWWENIERIYPDLRERPVYFVSSNTHSMANLLTGFAARHEDTLISFLQEGKGGDDRTLVERHDLFSEWQDIAKGSASGRRKENFLYYLLKKYQARATGAASSEVQRAEEMQSGLIRIPSEHIFDVEAQVIDLAALRVDWLDARLNRSGLDALGYSDALILNIDYPLGLGAYNILSVVAEQVGKVLGVYVMGKAASLNGAIGDVVLPNVVHDEHSLNTYLFANCFSSADIAPHLEFGSVLDNQKAVTVLGTFLQTRQFMDVFYSEGYTDIEMEAGPYLSAVYEMYRPTRHPVNELINLYGVPFDLGLVHYVSDTPLGKGTNLGVASLSYFGIDSTYAASLAILQRIFHQEIRRLASQRPG